MAFAAEKPSRAAATMKDVVSNGVGARSILLPSFMEETTRGSRVLSRAARASSWSVKRGVVCLASIASPSFAV